MNEPICPQCPDPSHTCRGTTRDGRACRHRSRGRHAYCGFHRPDGCRQHDEEQQLAEERALDDACQELRSYLAEFAGHLPLGDRFGIPCLRVLGFGDLHHLAAPGDERNSRAACDAEADDPAQAYLMRLAGPGGMPFNLPAEECAIELWSPRTLCGTDWMRVATPAEIAYLDAQAMGTWPPRRSAACARCEP